jgi:phage-related protein
MAIRSSLYFLYNGISSQSFGVLNVNISTGMFDEPFVATRNISEVKIRGKDRPFYTTMTNDPLQFQLSFALEDAFDSNKLRDIARWLTTTYYKTLQFSDNLDRVYYAILTSDSHLIHTGTNGYITVNFRCDSPYSYSPMIESQVYDLSSNPSSGTIVTFSNLGDLSISPEVWIKKIGAGNVSIKNLSNSGTTFTFTGLSDSETIYVDNQNQIIQSDILPTTYRYGNFNNNYMNMTYGNNQLLVTGACIVRFRYQYVYLQG